MRHAHSLFDCLMVRSLKKRTIMVEWALENLSCETDCYRPNIECGTKMYLSFSFILNKFFFMIQ